MRRHPTDPRFIPPVDSIMPTFQRHLVPPARTYQLPSDRLAAAASAALGAVPARAVRRVPAKRLGLPEFKLPPRQRTAVEAADWPVHEAVEKGRAARFIGGWRRMWGWS